MLGYGVDEMPPGPMRIKALVHPQDLARMAPCWSTCRRRAIAWWSRKLRLRHRSGRYVPVLARGFVSRDPSGRAVRVTGTAMNLTAQYQTRQLEALRTFALELIASEPDIAPILHRMVGQLEALLPSVRGVVWLVDEHTGRFEASGGPGPGRGAGEGPCGPAGPGQEDVCGVVEFSEAQGAVPVLANTPCAPSSWPWPSRSAGWTALRCPSGLIRAGWSVCSTRSAAAKVRWTPMMRRWSNG